MDGFHISSAAGVEMAVLVLSPGFTEEPRPFEDGRGQVELVNMDGGAVDRATFQSGWRRFAPMQSRSRRPAAARPATPATPSPAA